MLTRLLATLFLLNAPVCVHSSRDRLFVLRLGDRVVAVLATAVLLITTPALAIGSFSPSVFQFATTVKDDGKDAAGGWQAAPVLLRFGDGRSIIPKLWTCNLTVGMPLRTAAYGRISPETAAEIAASVATKASDTVMHSQEEWLAAAFCVAFIAEMNELFREDYKGLGARAYKP